MAKRKVNCIVLYDSNKYRVYNVTVKTKDHSNISLFYPCAGNDKLNLTKYETFHALELRVLRLLKNNNFYVHTWKEFNTTFYDIDFVDIHTGAVNRYCYLPDGEEI